ncbi:MAG TPA: kelch repeat-containing protein [Thermoleophilaceae bacterium]|nr:kelch repeat-containing protein [Thermoleophilaceae bacterium]
MPSRALLAGIVALGGAGVTAVALASTDARKSATTGWRPLAPAGLERTEVTAARIGRHAYVVGGFEKASGRTTAVMERYDLRADRWRRLRPLPLAVNHATAVAYRGRLYVHGGYTERRARQSAVRRLYEYTPRTGRWRRLPDSPTPRAAHAVAVLGGRLYAAGGANATGSVASMETYDFAARRWRKGPALGGPARDHTTGVASGGRFYVLGGREGTANNYAVAERFDPRRRSWQRLPAMARERAGIASVALPGGRIAVFGGEDFGTGRTIGEVELLDTRTRRWSRLPDMRTPRHGLGGVARGNRVYSLLGGPRPGFHFASTAEFLDVRPR